MALKSAQPEQQSGVRQFLPALLLLVVIISLFFFRSYLPGLTLFSNDGPLGTLVANSHRVPENFSGGWQDLNGVGFREGGAFPNLSYGLLLLAGPVGYSKLYVPFALLVLGLGAWTFFSRLGLTPVACLVGAIAATLNSGFFSAACWGVAAHPITIGMAYFALAAVVSSTSRWPWLKILAAGLALGIAVSEGADIGAIFSIFVAAFTVYHAWTVGEGPSLNRVVSGLGRVLVMAFFAILVAFEVILVLWGTQIKGVAVAQQDTTMSAQERWDFATQWSLPKREALTLLIPGLFGYRMDTPNPTSPFRKWFEGGEYWGRVGQAPGLDRFFEEGTPPPQQYLSAARFTGGGNYTGVLVVLLAAWAALQAMRKEKSVFSIGQRKLLWFWMAVAVVGLLLAFGRFAPFYRLLYAIPFFNTIRNPAKFAHVVNWAMIVMFAYGVHALVKQYMQVPLTSNARGSKGEGSSGIRPSSLSAWWSKAAPFDRKWTMGSALAIALAVLGWLAYASSRDKLVHYLRDFGPSAAAAEQIASFSIKEVLWFILFAAAAVALVTAILSGRFTGKRVRSGAALIGLFLVVDLGRANLPWIIYWDYPRLYASNPVLDELRAKSYEHRVMLFPLDQLVDFRRLSAEARPLAEAYVSLVNLYHIEWKQHQFPYYNIQCLEYVQMPREPTDLLNFRTRMAHVPLKYWQITNTRYLLGPTGLLPLFNQLDPQHRFRIAEGFDLTPKSGGPVPHPFNELTATNNPAGQYAVFEFTAALPRAGLYSNWQVNTNEQEALATLVSPGFDPAQTVLVSDSIPTAAVSTATNQSPGNVEFESYAPKHILLKAKAGAASVLLLNDHFDPNWHVTVDGKSVPLLRCNYVMRGVQVPAGEHQIEFRFAPPMGGLYVSLVAIGGGLILLGFLGLAKAPKQAAISQAPPVRQLEVVERK
jgi:hypothetical protein